MNDQVQFNSILLLLVSAALSVVTTLWLRSSAVKNKRIDDLEVAVAELKTIAAVVDTKITPLWAKVQKQMSNDLHHPDREHQEADDLIDKLENLKATPQETARLKVLFNERANSKDPKITDREKSIAKIMPVIMDLVLEEAESPQEDVEVGAVVSAPITKLKEVEDETEQ